MAGASEEYLKILKERHDRMMDELRTNGSILTRKEARELGLLKDKELKK